MTLAPALGWALDILIQIEAVKKNEELGRLRYGVQYMQYKAKTALFI